VHILAISGSLQEKSSNQRLLEAAVELCPPGAQVQIFRGIAELPHFNPDLEAAGTPASVENLRRAIGASDALLIACPEYGMSLPGSLKNAIDWLIGSGELERKVVAITASVPARERGRLGLRALADTLSAVRVTLVGGEPILRGPDEKQELSALLEALIAAAKAAKTE
jgi:chromate reductase